MAVHINSNGTASSNGALTRSSPGVGSRGFTACGFVSWDSLSGFRTPFSLLPSGNGDWVQFCSSGTALECWVNNANVLGSSGAALTTNTWWFIALSVSSAGAPIAAKGLAGAALTAISGGGTIASFTPTTLQLGGINAFSTESFVGKMYGWRVWSTNLTDAELQAESQQVWPRRRTNLWGFFPLINKDTGYLVDLSGAGHALTQGSVAPANFSGNPGVAFHRRPRRARKVGGGGAFTLAADAASISIGAQAVSLVYTQPAVEAPLGTFDPELVDDALVDVTVPVQGRFDPDLVDEAANTFTLSAAAASVLLSAQAAALKRNLRLNAQPSSVSINAQPAGLVRKFTLVAAPASVALSAQAVNLRAARKLSVAPASVAVTAQAVTLKRGLRLVADPSTVTISAQDVTFARGKRLTADPAAVSISAQAVALKYARRFVVDPAAVSLNAQATSLEVSHRLVADPAAITLSAQAVSMLRGKAMAADPATVSLNAQAASLRYARRLSANASAVTLSASAASLRASHAPLAANASTVSISAQAVTLRRARTLVAAPSTISISATATQLRAALRLVAGAGSVIITARDADLFAGTPNLPRTTWEGPLGAVLAYEVPQAELVAALEAALAGAFGADVVGPLSVVITGPEVEGMSGVPGCKQGDTPLIEATLLNADGTSMDLTDATGVKLYMTIGSVTPPPFNGVTMTILVPQSDTTKTGRVQYQSTAPQTANLGQHRVEFRVTFSGGKEVTAPGNGYRFFEVEARLAA